MSNENFNIDIKKEILDSIEIMIKNALKNLPYDVTRKARVIGINGNTYTILLDGTNYEVHSTLSFNLNDSVDVLVKQNNMNNLCLLPK